MRDGVDPKTARFVCINVSNGNVEGAINQRVNAAPLGLVEGVKMRFHALLVFRAITLASAAGRIRTSSLRFTTVWTTPAMSNTGRTIRSTLRQLRRDPPSRPFPRTVSVCGRGAVTLTRITPRR
jgi:hypothetical protein